MVRWIKNKRFFGDIEHVHVTWNLCSIIRKVECVVAVGMITKYAEIFLQRIL